MNAVSLRYAILHHQPASEEAHFDLLFETAPGSSLATWRSPVWPIDVAIEVKRIKDHRRVFLDYEGEIGGGRGYVTRIAGGACEVSVGPEATWAVRLLTGTRPQVLNLRLVHSDVWQIEPG